MLPKPIVPPSDTSNVVEADPVLIAGAPPLVRSMSFEVTDSVLFVVDNVDDPFIVKSPFSLSLKSASMTVAPAVVTSPLMVTPVSAVRLNVPSIVDAPILMAVVSRKATLFPLLTVTTPVKSLEELFRVMSFPEPAASVVVPVTVSAPPVCVTAPVEVSPNVPEIVEVPRSMALASTSVTLFPLVMDTVPEKSFDAPSSVTLFPDPATMVVAPVMASVPESETAPPAVNPKVPEMVEAPRSMAPASTSVTLFPEVITTVLKLLELSFKVMSLSDSAAIVAVPVTTRVPESVTAPPVFNPKVPEMVEAPKSIAPESTRVTLFPLVTATVPKLLELLSRVILFPDPAAIVVVPVTVSVPVSVTAPPAVKLNVVAVRLEVSSTVSMSRSSVSVNVTVWLAADIARLSTSVVLSVMLIVPPAVIASPETTIPPAVPVNPAPDLTFRFVTLLGVKSALTVTAPALVVPMTIVVAVTLASSALDSSRTVLLVLSEVEPRSMVSLAILDFSVTVCPVAVTVPAIAILSAV